VDHDSWSRRFISLTLFSEFLDWKHQYFDVPFSSDSCLKVLPGVDFVNSFYRG